MIPNTLVKGAELRRGEHIISTDQHFSLVHNFDGNVLLCDEVLKEVIWSTDTYGKQTSVLKMQEDSNLVLYSTSDQPLWASNTWNSGASEAVMQTDGNFVLYDNGRPIWASETYKGIDPRDKFHVNQGLRSRDELTSSNGKNKLCLENDGNLVLRKDGKIAWDSKTAGTNANVLVLQCDGNLVLYNDEKPVWASDTWKKKSDFAIMQDDGNFVLYTKDGEPVWASGTS